MSRPKSNMPVEEWINHLDIVLDDYIEEFMSWDHSINDLKKLLQTVMIRTVKRWKRVKIDE